MHPYDLDFFLITANGGENKETANGGGNEGATGKMREN